MKGITLFAVFGSSLFLLSCSDRAPTAPAVTSPESVQSVVPRATSGLAYDSTQLARIAVVDVKVRLLPTFGTSQPAETLRQAVDALLAAGESRDTVAVKAQLTIAGQALRDLSAYEESLSQERVAVWLALRATKEALP